MPRGSSNGFSSVDGMSMSGTKLTRGQGLFCVEIGPDTGEIGTFKNSLKNTASPFETVANGEAVILIGSNSVSS
jgi:hypothetical protein